MNYRLFLALFIVLTLTKLYAQEPQWLVQSASTFPEEKCTGLTTDKTGNILITGGFSGQATFGATVLNSNGMQDLFIVKYNSSGTVVWAKNYGGTQEESGFGITTDKQENIYVTGGFSGNAIFDGNSLTALLGIDMFVLKLDKNGNVLWARQGGCGGIPGVNVSEDKGKAIAVDKRGNVFITGHLADSLSADFNAQTLSSFGNKDYFVAKYDSTGTLKWVRRGGGTNYLGGQSIAVDTAGNSYTTGSFRGICDFESTIKASASSLAEDIFILKLDSAGNLKYIKIAVTTGRSFGIAADPGGNTYITGCISSSATFGSDILATPPGDTVAFTAKCNPTGQFIWGKKSVNKGTATGIAICRDTLDNLFITGGFGYGSFIDSIRFSSDPLRQVGKIDVFVVKYDTSGQFKWAQKGTATDGSLGIAVDKADHVYVAGTFTAVNGGSITFGCNTLSTPGTSSAFLTKISTNTITTNALLGSVFCAGDSVKVKYSVTNPICGNEFYVQLSDSLGNFYYPVNIDTISSNTSDSITTAIPISVTSGNKYRIRVVSAQPHLIGSNNGSDITIKSKPVTPTVAGKTICAGNDTILTATAPGGSYLWYDSISGGNTIGTGSVFTTPILFVDTSFYVQTTISGCTSDRAKAMITVNPSPVAPVISLTGTNPFCTGDSVTLTSTLANGYLWNNGFTTQSIVVKAGGTYTVTVNNVFLCTSSDTFSVTETLLPAAPTVANQVICAGNDTLLTATAPGGSYEWYDAAIGGTNIGSGVTFSTPILFADTSYYVQTTLNGCTGPRAQVDITVTPLPASPTAANQSVCSGNSTTLTATAPGGTYGWYNTPSGGTNISIGSGFTTPVITMDTSFYVQTTINNCTSSRTQVSVTVNPTPSKPVITLTGTNPFCDGDSVLLTSSAAAGYLWNTGSTAQSIVVKNGGYYDVTINNIFLCTNVEDTTLTKSTMQLTLFSPTYDGVNNISVLHGNDGSIDLTPSGGIGIYTYNWSNGATSQDISQLIAGKYLVIVMDSVGCSLSDSLTLREPSEFEIPDAFSPNGDGKNDVLKLIGLGAYPTNTLVIFNRWGNEVYSKSNYTNDWNGSNNGDELPDGTYFLIFKGSGGAEKEIVVKQYIVIKR